MRAWPVAEKKGPPVSVAPFPSALGYSTAMILA